MRQKAIEVEKLRIRVMEAHNKYKEKEQALKKQKEQTMAKELLPQESDKTDTFEEKKSKLQSFTEEFDRI